MQKFDKDSSSGTRFYIYCDCVGETPGMLLAGFLLSCLISATVVCLLLVCFQRCVLAPRMRQGTRTAMNATTDWYDAANIVPTLKMTSVESGDF